MIKYYCDKDKIEENAIQPILNRIQEMNEICVFPDIHYCSEKSLPVGIAFSSIDKFYPLVIGKDIGCGVIYLKFQSKHWKKPFNKNIHYNSFNKASLTFTDEGLGTGNHFLSIEEGDDGNTYIICHTGTRNLGINMHQQFKKMIMDFNYNENVNGEYLPIEYYTEELHNKYNNILKIGEKRRIEFVQKTLKFLEHNGYINANINYDTQDSVHNVFRVLDGKRTIHRKGATELINSKVVIPISMTRGSLIVEPKPYLSLEENLYSCAHGAGRKLSRTDTLKFWHSMKNKEKKIYEQNFPELLNRNGKFSNGHLQEFDFAYKDSDTMIKDQPFLNVIAKTKPIVTVKFTEI